MLFLYSSSENKRCVSVRIDITAWSDGKDHFGDSLVIKSLEDEYSVELDAEYSITM